VLLSACATHLQQSGPIVPVPPAYTVKKGDTLSTIAKHYMLDPLRIAELNALDPPYALPVGRVLQLPNHHGDPDTMALAQVPPEPPVSDTPLVPRAVESAPLGPPPKAGMVDTSSPTALAPPPEAPPPPTTASDGTALPALLWPVKGEIVSSFGPKEGGLKNDGINIAAAEGTPVKAAASGTVAYAGDELKGFGNLILIRHDDGWVTAYAHLASMSVKKDQAVRAGQQIGTVGQTGTIDSPQLHFELRHGKEAVDPSGKLS
jgi:murein DD-endopeptidase MepM/ murein hydrolase activator NlpD